MKYDDILKILGEFGPFQRKIYFLVCLPAISVALHKFVWIFIAAVPNTRCRLPLDDVFNYTLGYNLPDEIHDSIIPYDSKVKQFSQCEYYKIEIKSLNFTYNNWSSFSEDVEIDSQTIEQCTSWVYDTSEYPATLTTDLNLICSKEHMRSILMSVFMIGELFGSIICGTLSDIYGRKLIFVISLLMQTVIGCLFGIVKNYTLLLIFRFIIGFFAPGVYVLLVVLGIELVGPSKRTNAGVGVQFFFGFGYLILTGIAYLIRDWQMLALVVALPGFFFIVYWWLIPESGRWLLNHGRVDECRKLLGRIAESNKTTLPEDVLDESVLEDDHVEQENNPLLLLKYPNIRKKFINLCYCWFVNSFVYYGLSFNTSNLGGNSYLNFLLAALTEFPAYIICIFIIQRFGRKIPLCITMLIAGVALLLTSLFNPDNVAAIVSLAMIGKLGITISFAIIYIFSAELYPTVIRNIGMGSSSLCGRIGSFLSSYMFLLTSTWRPLPLILFGLVASSSAFLILFLPETRGVNLPETIEDGEKFGKKGSKVSKNEAYGEDIVSNGKCSVKLIEVESDTEIARRNVLETNL